jgi:hypothetical protein
MVSAAAQGVLCRGDPSAGAAIRGHTYTVLSVDLNHSREVCDRQNCHQQLTSNEGPEVTAMDLMLYCVKSVLMRGNHQKADFI